MAKGGYADLGDYYGRRREHEAIEDSEGEFMDPVDYIREAHTARTEVDRLGTRIHELEEMLRDILGTADEILAEMPSQSQAYWALEGMKQIARNCRKVGIERRGAAGR